MENTYPVHPFASVLDPIDWGYYCTFTGSNFNKAFCRNLMTDYFEYLSPFEPTMFFVTEPRFAGYHPHALLYVPKESEAVGRNWHTFYSNLWQVLSTVGMPNLHNSVVIEKFDRSRRWDSYITKKMWDNRTDYDIFTTNKS